MWLWYVIEAIVMVYAAFTAKQAADRARALAKNGQGLNYTVRNSVADRRIVYGRRRLGGIECMIAASGPTNLYLNYILIISEGPNEEVKTLILDSTEVLLDSWDSDQGYASSLTGRWPGKGGDPGVRVRFRKGVTGETPMNPVGGLDFPGWGSSDKLLGISAACITYRFSVADFPNGVPNPSFIVKGRNDIVDPRTTSGLGVCYTNNAALCQNHYVMMHTLGPGLAWDEIGIPELIHAADVCDAAVLLKDGVTVIRKYSFDAVVTTASSSEEIINTFMSAMAGWRVYSSGKWRVYAGEWIDPTFTITKSMLVSGLDERTRTSKADRINTVRSTYCSEDNQWQTTDCPPFSIAAFVSDDGEALPIDMNFDFASNIALCRRLSKITLMQARYSGTRTIKCSVEALPVLAGRPVLVNIPELGFDNVPQDVLNMTFSITNGVIEIQLDLKDTDPSIFAWDPSDGGDNDHSDYSPPAIADPLPMPPGRIPGDEPPLFYSDIYPLWLSGSGLTVSCKSRGGTYSLIGHDPFVGSFSPPRKWLRKTWSGALQSRHHYYGDGSGYCDAGGGNDLCNCVESGAYAWDPVTGAVIQSDGQYVVGGYTNSHCPNGTHAHAAAAGPANDWGGPETKTATQYSIGPGGCFTEGMNFAVTVETSNSKAVLSQEDTDELAKARLDATLTDWDATSMVWGTCVAQTAIWDVRTGLTATIRDLKWRAYGVSYLPFWDYELEVKFARRAAGSSDPWVVYLTTTYSLEPGLDGIVDLVIDVPNEQGWETRVDSATFIDS